MSAAKMVADSTQVDPDPLLSHTKRKKSGQKKKVKKQKKQTDNKQKSEDENDSDVDLTIDMKPIGDYIKDRQKMLEEMFISLDGPSLQRHIPDVLKEIPMEELKRRCLEQLEVMSKKRICRILQGDDPANISSSGTEEDSSDEEHRELDGKENEKGVKVECKSLEESSVTSTGGKTDSIPDDDMELRNLGNDQDIEEGSEDGEIQMRKIILPEEEEISQIPEGETDAEAKQDADSSSKHATEYGKGDKSENTELGSVLTSNQMELLELEMRARAIKAMLKANELKEKQLRENT